MLLGNCDGEDLWWKWKMFNLEKERPGDMSVFCYLWHCHLERGLSDSVLLRGAALVKAVVRWVRGSTLWVAGAAHAGMRTPDHPRDIQARLTWACVRSVWKCSGHGRRVWANVKFTSKSVGKDFLCALCAVCPMHCTFCYLNLWEVSNLLFMNEGAEAQLCWVSSWCGRMRMRPQICFIPKLVFLTHYVISEKEPTSQY